MRKLVTLLLLTLCCNQASARIYRNFNLDDFIARHPIAQSYDPISRCFTGSDKLQKQIASISERISLLNNELAALNTVQSKDTAIVLDTTSSSDEAAFWQKNRVQSDEVRELKINMLHLIDQKRQLEQLLTRDTGILTVVSDLVADVRAQFSDDTAVYLNYLPTSDTGISEQWLSSPLQIFLWAPQEKYIEDYLENSYAISLIFPASLRPVVYQKSFEGENNR
ncbi:MAG: hypothetical protein ACD_39C00297G0003 [uncultured bacterium]|nr:MAG: hypothetical protein ACD_39C00297G0003 [uncultured bacterium]